MASVAPLVKTTSRDRAPRRAATRSLASSTAWRATSLGIYRFWRDLGYAVGALLSGAVADLVGLGAAIHLVAALTFASGLVVAAVMRRPEPVASAS